METKRCSSCKKEKELELFVRYKMTIDGRHNQCKQCRRDFYNNNKERLLRVQKEYALKNKEEISLRSKLYRQTKRGKIMAILSNIKKRCENPTNKRYARYGGRGIKNFLTYKDISFLFDRDKASEMKRASIDRKDNDGNYSIENCQFIEFVENSIKDTMVKVRQIDFIGKVVKVWDSISQAERTGFQHSNIIKCCKGLRRTHKGFRWEYLS